MKTLRVQLAFLAIFAAQSAFPQAYPHKPVRVVIPFTPGSGTDVVARAVCPKLAEILGQQVLVENRPGAGGSIASSVVAKSPADGYTLLWHSNAFAANPALYGNLPYDPLKDFVPISALASTPLALVISPAAGAKSVAELIAAAKAKPKMITYGSAGTGSGTHFAAEKFKLAAEIDAVHVPYRGGPEPTADVIAGRVTYWFAPILLAAPHVREGRLLALGVTSRNRVQHLPEVPTIAEAGLPNYSYTIWWGLWAPAAIPTGVRDKLAKDMARTLAATELRERLAQLGAEPMNMLPDEFARFVVEEMAESARLVQAANMKPD